MDPYKKLCKHKEQINMEHAARRNYNKRWGQLKSEDLFKSYNQNAINRQLIQDLNLKDLCPNEYTGDGESYFVSKDMYNALMSKCRCGRKRNGIHLMKCLQKAKDMYSDADETADEETRDDQNGKTTVQENSTKPDKKNVPNTTSGWHKNKPNYKQWEQSMKYISPVYNMPGHRIDDRPYNVIFIG